jgi:hypothetical protein
MRNSGPGAIKKVKKNQYADGNAGRHSGDFARIFEGFVTRINAGARVAKKNWMGI